MADKIVDVNISLNTAGVSRAGFGTMCFIGTHNWFQERVRTYNSLDAVAQDVPTDSDEWKAASRAFGQSPSPTEFKIGRRQCSTTLTPEDTTQGKVYTATITVNDGDSVAASYTVGAAETEEDIVDGIKAAIDGDANVAAHVTATKNGTGAATTLTISATAPATDLFSITSLSADWSYTQATTEVAADVYTAVKAEDSAFYAVATNDHTEVFVLALAAIVATEDRMYFVSSQEVTSLSAYSLASTDILAQLVQLDYENVVGFFSDTADTNFPEAGFFSLNSVYTPGEVIWTNLSIIGEAVAKHPTTGLVLSSTEQGYLDSRNTSYMYRNERLGVSINAGGKVVSGEWIDVVRFKHYWKAKLEEGVGTILINQSGRKLGGNRGINIVRSMCEAVTDPLVSNDTVSRGLDSYRFIFPDASDVSLADKQSRILRGTFEGFLTGAFGTVKITGNLTYQGL